MRIDGVLAEREHWRMRLTRGERLACASVVLCLVASCSGADAPPRVDTLGTTATLAPPPAEPAVERMNALGGLLVVPGDSSGTGIVIYPAVPTTQLVGSAPLKLITPGGDSTMAGAALVATDSQVCGEAALVRVQDSLGTAWSIGILGSDVSPVRMDSIDVLSRADSTRLVADLARLASTIPMQSDSRFQGLPFVVSSARRFEGSGRQIVVSQLVRRVPHEAAPVEEHTFIVAERDSGSTAYTMAFQLRSEGSEETAEQFDVLAVVRGASALWLLLSRDNTAQTTYQVLERVAPGTWRSRWTRVLSC
jgi:hypothetical protein